MTYLIASIPFGVVLTRWVGKTDVRNHGSGNIGATNVARVLGKKWGILVLLLDALKGFIVVKASNYFGSLYFQNWVAFVAVLAHCYPVYLKFKGGKGVATALGVLAAIAPMMVVMALVVFTAAVSITRIISIGSLLAAITVAVASAFLDTDLTTYSATLIGLLIVWKHRENIKRILTGREPRFF